MKNTLITLLLLIPFSFFTQTETRHEAKVIAESVAQSQIQQLKSGVLLVRLYNKQNVIGALEAKGMMRRAKAVREKQKKVNKEIATSFKNFTFCEVFFFFSSDSPNLINGDYSKVKLFSDTGMSKEIVLEGPNFFVADFGILKDENTSDSSTAGNSNSGRTKVKKYKGSSNNTNKRCMFLRTNELEQLKKPFPYRVWFHPTPIQNLSYEQVVERMNKQLSKFYAMNK